MLLAAPRARGRAGDDCPSDLFPARAKSRRENGMSCSRSSEHCESLKGHYNTRNSNISNNSNSSSSSSSSTSISQPRASALQVTTHGNPSGSRKILRVRRKNNKQHDVVEYVCHLAWRCTLLRTVSSVDTVNCLVEASLLLLPPRLRLLSDFRRLRHCLSLPGGARRSSISERRSEVLKPSPRT